MTIWVARAGKNGEREVNALEEGRAYVGWDDLGDLSQIKSKDEIEKRLEEQEPDLKQGRIKNHASQLYNFMRSIKKGDTFALPLKTRPAIAFGEVVGDYEYIPDNPSGMRHSRKIKWKGEPIPRAKFNQDLLYSFGSALTVFTVRRNDAEERVRAIIEDKPYKFSTPSTHDVGNEDQPQDGAEDFNVVEIAKGEINDFIGRKFKGHEMERLVAEVLKAQGFTVKVNARKGADGGADILAGKGHMGFDEPRLCVQVKSSETPVGSKDYDELKGVMHKFSAKYGLIVAWGGFNRNVQDEARRDFFNVRLWTGENLVEEIQKVYDKLPDELQTEIPLQRTWALVQEG